MTLPRKHGVLNLLLTIGILSGLLFTFAPLSVKPVRADNCSWGDIICDMQQAIQQLADQYVTPLKAWVQLQANKALYSLEYTFARTVAGFMWSISKMLTTVGVGIGVLNQWLATSFFQPMIQMTSTTLKPIVGVFLFAALGILGLSYFLAAFIRLNVVNLRSVIVWWIAGGIFFSIGPSFYLSMRQLNQTLSSVFYASSLQTISTQNPFVQLAAGDPAASSPVYAMSPLCSNFSAYLPGSAGNINGLDVTLAFQKADGFDVIGGGAKCLGGGDPLDIPRNWLAANGFFDAAIAPDSWPAAVTCPPAPAVCDYDSLIGAAVTAMQTAVNQNFAGIAREWQTIPMTWFAIVEQLVALCLLVAQGLTFVSFGCAILFAFFQRTEPIAMAVIDQWLALLVQSVVIALLQGMCVALYLAAAKSGSPLVSLAVSIAMLVMMLILLVSGLKAIWSAFNRLFEAFGQASGGVFLSPGKAAASMAGVALTAGGAAATGGLSLMAGAASLGGAVADGVQAANNGATWAQTAGVMLGGSKALDGAAYHVSRIPALQDTPLGEAASQYTEGASLRQVGEGVLSTLPVVGKAVSRMAGASVGAALLTDRNPDNVEAVVGDEGRVTWQPPLLNRSANNAVAGLLRNPSWASDSANTGDDVPLYQADGEPVRRGDVLNNNVPTSVSLNNSGDLDETLDDDFKRDLSADRQAHAGTDTGAQSLSQAAQALNTASSTLNSSAESLRQMGQTTTSSVNGKATEIEGRLTVTGTENLAAVLGRTIDALTRDNGATGQRGATNERLSAVMSGVMGITSIEGDGKPIPPIEGRLSRYQLFAEQALQMGLSGAESAQVLRDVKANPQGQLLQPTRDRLIHEQHEEHGMSWADSVQNVQLLEQAARIVPTNVTAYGTRVVTQSADSGQPIRLDAGSTAGGAVIFTPAAQPDSPTTKASTAQSTGMSSALDGMKSIPTDHEIDLSEQDSQPHPLRAAQQESEL